MKHLPFYFMFMALSSVAHTEELPCSKNGTNVLYINGMFNSKGGSNTSRNLIEDIYRSKEVKESIDNGGVISFGNVYQRSLYRLNSENTPLPDEIGAMSDIIEVAGQYIQDQIDVAQRDDATFWQAMSSHFFKAGATAAQVHPTVGASLIRIKILDKLYQGFFVEELGDTVDEGDLQRMISAVRGRLVNEQKKMIIVSHSQGNFYANRIWNRLIRDGGIDENYENYWGNLQLATPTSYIAAKHGVHMTAHQDKYMNSFFVLGNLPPNIYLDSTYKSVDQAGHNFSLYVSPTVNGSPFSDHSISGPMESIFRSRMTDIAKSLAPNCGCDDKDYPLAVHENGGGLIGQFAEVSPLARVNSGATVCGVSKISSYVQLDAGAVIKDSELVAPFSTLEPDEITAELETDHLTT